MSTTTDYIQKLVDGGSPVSGLEDSLIFQDDTNSRIGIGTAGPDARLEVSGGDITLDHTDGGYMAWKKSGAAIGYVGNSADLISGASSNDFTVRATANLQFAIGAIEKMRIDNGGNVGIGDTSPDHKLDVAGNIGMDVGGYLNFGDTDGSSGYGLRDNSGTIEIKDSGGSWGAIGGAASNDMWTRTGGAVPKVALTTTTDLVGIGTSNPANAYNLHVHGSMQLSGNVNARLQLCADYSGDKDYAALIMKKDSVFEIETSVSYTGLTQNTTGCVGIGTNGAAPYKLIAWHDYANGYAGYFFNDGDDNNRNVLYLKGGAEDGTGDNNMITCCRADGTQEGYLEIDDNVLQIEQASDSRRKENVADSGAVLEILKKLRVVDFSFVGKDVRHKGLIAQEVKDSIPKLAGYHEHDDVWTIKPLVLIPYLVKAVQELSAEVKALKSR